MEQAIAAFLDQGLMGAGLVILGTVTALLWRENKQLQKENRDTLIAWRDDKAATVTQVTTALNNTATSIASFNDKIDVVKRGQ